MTPLEREIKEKKYEVKLMQSSVQDYWRKLYSPETPAEARTREARLAREGDHQKMLQTQKTLRAKRHRAFMYHLLLAHLRGKIHCTKLTKTDLPIPLAYRDRYASDRFPEPGPRPAQKGLEIRTLEDQERLLLLMLAQAKKQVTNRSKLSDDPTAGTGLTFEEIIEMVFLLAMSKGF